MSTIATDPSAYYFVTGRDIRVDFVMEAIASDDAAISTATAEDLSDVTAAEVAIRLTGTTGAATSWTTAGGQIVITGNTVALNVDKAVTALLTPGRYQGQLNLTRSGGVDECALRFVVVLEAGVGG